MNSPSRLSPRGAPRRAAALATLLALLLAMPVVIAIPATFDSPSLQAALLLALLCAASALAWLVAGSARGAADRGEASREAFLERDGAGAVGRREPEPSPEPMRPLAMAPTGSRLLGDLSHELHTQLNGLIGMSDLLLGTYLTPEQRRYAGALTRAGRNLQAVIRDMLDISRIETGALRLDAAEFDLTRCLEDALEAVSERAQSRGLELVGNLSRDLPSRVRGDQARLGQALRYLTGHLIGLTHEGAVVARASLMARDADRARIRIELTARGLDRVAAHRDLDVAAFGRDATAQVSDYGGPDLSLGIVRALVRLMGGESGYRAESPEGACFWIELSLAVARWEVLASAPLAQLDGQRLLLLTPTDALGETLATYAREAGVAVDVHADSGSARVALREALARAEPFTAVLVDAETKGLESLLSETRLREEPALATGSRILLGPGRAHWRDERAAALDVTAYLPKPARRAQLLACLAGESPASALPDLWSEPCGPPCEQAQTPPLRLKVLVADDNAVNQETAAAMLGVLGCEARLVFDGQAAIDACARESYDLVLMDCKMPLLDGYEATRRIRLQESADPGVRTPIIALTAHVMEGDEERCRSAGMDGYLTKPVSLSALRAALLRWSRRRSGLQANTPHGAGDPPPESGPGLAIGVDGSATLDDLARWPILDPAMLDEIKTLSPQSGLALVARLMRSYLDSEPGLLAKVREGFATAQPQRLGEAARALRAAAWTLGAIRLATLCERLERIPGSALTLAAATQWIAVLEGIAAETRQAIEERLGEPTTASPGSDAHALPVMELGFSPAGSASAWSWDSAAREADAGEADARARPLVLVVDDNPAIHAMARSTFEKYGLRFAGARDGQGALEAVRFQRPDLILLDLMMPGMDGYETCQRLRQVAGLELVPILVVTGLEDLASIEQAYDSGATDFQAKPLNWHLLAYRIRYLLRAHATLAALHRSEASNSALVAAIPDALMRLDRKGRVLQLKSGLILSKVGVRLEANVSELADVLPEAVCAVIRRELEATLCEHGMRELEIELADEQGEALAFDARLIAVDADQAILLLRDMTERQRRQRVIQQLAFQDSLTGLANRQQFNLDLAGALSRARRREDRLALLYLDLDQFKRINDSLGHGIGDELLRAAAQRLQDAVDEATMNLASRGIAVANTVARLGGDELTAILNGNGSERIAMQVAERILEKFREPFQCSGHHIVCTVSIGIALSLDDGETPETLLKHADTALYAAKLQGRDTYRFFTPSMGERALQRLDVEARLRQALARGEFCLHYQPLVDGRSHEYLGLEALLRWQDPQQGLLEPEAFIPVAEDSGLILPMGIWVIEEIGRQLAQWSRQGIAVPISINLSDAQFGDQGLIERLLRLARGRPSGMIELEITESLLLARDVRLMDALTRLREKGFRVAIDNFGTGYSSLALLKHLPIDTLKIDRSFVREIGRDATTELLIRTIIAMGRGLGLRVVAEGVESEEQRAFLVREGCHAIQGFLFASPVPAALLDVERLHSAESGDEGLAEAPQPG